MAEDKFKLPQSSYEELCKIIMAYGQHEEPASNPEISRISSLHPTIISRNAGFLTAIGVLESGQKKSLTSIGKNLSHALDHQESGEISDLWSEIVLNNDFLSKLLSAIRIRNGMDEQTFISHIAYSAGQPKKPQFMTGSRSIIDILRIAALIKEVDGKILTDSNKTAEKAIESARNEMISKYDIPEIGDPHDPTTISYETIFGTDIRIQINVNVDCKPAEIESVGVKLRGMLKSIKMSDTQNDSVENGSE